MTERYEGSIEVTTPPPMGDLPARLKAARLARGLTQMELADQIGMTRSSIANTEAGRQEIPVRTMLAIARALGETAASLLGEAPIAALPTVTIRATHVVTCADCGWVAAEDEHEAARAERIRHLREDHLEATE